MSDFNEPQDDPVAEASRSASDRSPNDEQLPDQSGMPSTDTGADGGLSTVPLSAEDLDPDDELLDGAPIDDPGADSSMS